MCIRDRYKDIDDEKLFENLKYFLERIMPVCDKYDINTVSYTHLRVGIQDKFGKSGKPDQLFAAYGLTAENIIEKCKATLA